MDFGCLPVLYSRRVALKSPSGDLGAKIPEMKDTLGSINCNFEKYLNNYA